ncbi:MAG: FliA/WhiG family RNA polymerase sigma factor [Phycisphaerales bacterium]|nr:MAG: FliA/WhiG family RNA polymerase sigma factor [Phycisphaerales bacterium]
MAPQVEQISEQRLAQESRNHLNNVALRAYSKQSCRDNMAGEQIAEFLPMVNRIARQVVTYLKPPLSFEDMVSAGTMGLVRAARDFDPSHHAEFKTYAYIRIRGAILDELRCWSFVPANLNKRIREAQQLSRKITEETGTPPTDPELAERLGVTVEELYETFENARAQHFISLDGSTDESPALGTLLAAPCAASPDERIQRAELVEKLAEAIRQLFEKQQQVVLLYYQQQLTMKEIAEIMGLTESRVSQLHASALFSLSIKLRQWKDGGL